MRRSHFSLALCAVVMAGVCGSQAALSQERTGQRDRVCVYEHAGYGGWERCYGLGEEIRDLGNDRNRISSVRIFGRAEITLYEHPSFQGSQVVIDNDVQDLSRWRGWNDSADSLRVARADFRGRPRQGRGEGGRGEDRICVYQHVQFRGNSQCFDAWDEVRDLRQIGWNDGISSIRVFGRSRVAFYEHSEFQGQRLVVDRDIPDLTQVRGEGNSNWNDRISSVRAGGGRW